jgi:uncharacterized small protein (DUF1192 family)
MTDDEDQAPRRRQPSSVPDLTGWSVAELEAYIARLEVEMARARAEIASKESVRSAAEALFRKS